MSFELPKLPYPTDALEPHMSARTLELHHGKHHQGYVDKLNDAVKGTPLAKRSLEDLVRTESGGVFNNAAQIWNHSFYWQCMSPDGGGKPGRALAEAIDNDIGSLDAFKKEMAQVATGHFGSGWAWLVIGADAKLHVLSTADADTPIRNLQVPLLTLDMWEHAYYVDYFNDKDKYVNAYLNHLINWQFADRNYAAWVASCEAA